MTKTESRAAAKAYHQEKERRRREERHAEAVAADLEGGGASFPGSLRPNDR